MSDKHKERSFIDKQSLTRENANNQFGHLTQLLLDEIKFRCAYFIFSILYIIYKIKCYNFRYDKLISLQIQTFMSIDLDLTKLGWKLFQMCFSRGNDQYCLTKKMTIRSEIVFFPKIDERVLVWIRLQFDTLFSLERVL